MNNELLILLLTFLLVALVAAIYSPLGFVAWLREEWRLLRADSWADGEYRGPGTRAHPNVAYLEVRQRAMAKRMRRQGRALLGPKANRKAWNPNPHVLTQPSTPHADNVVQLRTAGAKR